MLFRIALILALLFTGIAAAEEIRSPVCPVSFGNLPCILNGANSQGLLSDYEMIYLDVSNGYYLGDDNFYYAGINYRNSEIDLFSKRYNIVSINSMDAILTNDIYKNENNLQLYKGKELILKDGYSLELSDIGERSARFSLKKNNAVLESTIMNINGIFSYKINVNGKEVEVFRTKLMGTFGNMTIIKDTYLRDIKIVKNGELFGDHEIKLKDIDGDGDLDIVYSLKNKKFNLPDNGTITILDKFLSLRTYPAYVPFYESLEDLNLVGEDNKFRIFSLNGNLTMPVPSFLNSPPEGAIIASAVPAGINTGAIVVYKNSNSSINELRGDHTFYIYTRGNLRLTVKKQDMNWYIGSDALLIKLYSSTNLIKSITIPDDGNTVNNSMRGAVQDGTLEASVPEGVYKVTMTGGSGADVLIRSIELNSGNIVVQNPYLAGWFYTGGSGSTLYTRAVKGDRLGFLTYHTPSLQTVNVVGSSFTKSIDITAVSVWYYIDLPPSNELYRIEVPIGDVIINANSYFSFSEDSYFSTASAKVLPLQNRMEWLEQNKVDYVIVPSSSPVTGIYLFKPITAKVFNVRSPKSPWVDYSIDTWSAPNVFNFDPDKDDTWEYLTINNSGGNNINRERIRYTSIQTGGKLGFRGKLYRVLDETYSEIVMSGRLADIDSKTLFLNREWQVGGIYTLSLKDVSSDGKYAIMELSRSGNPVSRQIIPTGGKMFYNGSFKGKNVTLFQSELKEIFQETSTSFVRISDVELYDENIITIKSGASENETTDISDFNEDGYLDVSLTPKNNLLIEKNARNTLFNSYLDFVVGDDGKTFYLERKISLPSALVNSSNIDKEIQYILAPFFPAYNMTLTFSDFNVTSVVVNAKRPISQIGVNLKELKNRPDDIIIKPEGAVYKYFSLSLDTENLKNATLHFRVKKSWMDSNSADNASIALFEFNDGVWDILPTYGEGNNDMYAYYQANIEVFSTIFAIAASTESSQVLQSWLQPESDAEKKNLLEDYERTDQIVKQSERVDKSGMNSNYDLIYLILLIPAALIGYLVYKKSDLIKNTRVFLILSKISSELFNSLLITFLLLLLIENIWENSVSEHINLNYLMLIVLIFGIISIYSSSAAGNMNTGGRATRKEYFIIVCIGIAGMMIIWSKIKYMGFISYPISIISGILIVLLSILMLEENDIRDSVQEE